MKQLHAIPTRRLPGGVNVFADYISTGRIEAHQQEWLRQWSVQYARQTETVRVGLDTAVDDWPTFRTQGIEFRTAARRDEALEIARIIGRMHQAVARLEGGYARRDDPVAITIGEYEWRMIRHYLTYGEIQRYFGPEGAQPTFCGWPLAIIPDVRDPLMARW